jgi:archaemetzincin
MRNVSQPAYGTIALLPIGSIEHEVLCALEEMLGEQLRRKTVLRPLLSEPVRVCTRRRDQYLATELLRWALGQGRAVAYERVLCIIDHDLYVPRLNFVFGIALGDAALISITRLRQEYYGFASDTQLFRRRIVTEAIHELGHTYGLRHCPNPSCVMFFSNSLMDTDKKGPQMCSSCRRQYSQLKGNTREQSIRSGIRR